MNNQIKKEAKEIRGVLGRIKRRDFKGNSGQAIKNSSYQLMTNLVKKIGSFLFTIIVAKMLLPEKYGLYALALSTIMMFIAFSDAGTSSAMTTFGSKMLGKNKDSKAKGYLKKLLIWKIKLLAVSSIALLFLGYFMARYWYNKPIFYALVVGAFYIPIVGLMGFLEIIFRIENKFKYPLIKEVFFQIIKLILIPLSVLILLSISIKDGAFIAIIFAVLTFCYLCSFLLILYLIKKKAKFTKTKTEELTKKEIKHLKIFILPLIAIMFSTFFINFVDMFMLGKFIEDASYLGYYSIAFTLSTAAAALLGFIPTSLAPIFAKINGLKLESLFKKSKNFIILISIFGGIITYILSPVVINIIDEAYGPAIPLLKLFSILVMILPATSVYSMYYVSREKTATFAKLTIGTTVLNIILNYIFILIGLQYSMFYAVLGACIATIISRSAYLGGLIIFRNKK